MKKLKIIFGIAALAFVVSAFSFREDLFLVSKNLDIFAAVYKDLNINYVEETSAPKLMRIGIDAMLESLDPYTQYVPESEIEDYRLKYVSTQYGGVGAVTIFLNGKLFVSELIEGYPADKAQITPGDRVVAINDLLVKDKSRAEISQLLRGPKGSAVSLTLERDGKQTVKKIIRDEILQPNVPYYGIVNNNLGYIKLDKFLENSAAEVTTALSALQKSNPKGIVLDLRNNGGGILQEAVKIVNLFVAKNQIVVTQRGKNPEKSIVYKTLSDPIAPSLPLVVLINANAASASEIVAGALQDLDRAVIVGQRSYGKGLVQQAFNLPYNSLVKITVAKYYTPSGRCIQKLDYGHRAEDGNVEKFADSLAVMYKTTKDRAVYSGNGVFPDVFVEAPKLSPITITMINKNLFFDFANQFKKNNPSIKSAEQFKLSDADYVKFTSALPDRELTYTSKTERLLSELRLEAEKENKSAEVQADLENLKYKLTSSKKTDLVRHKEEIKQYLEGQIISRYFYQDGRVKQSFQYDTELKAAEDVLDNKAKMLSILDGEGDFKVIGKPIKI